MPCLRKTSEDMVGRKEIGIEFKFLMDEVEKIVRIKNCWKGEDEKWNLKLVVKLLDSVRDAFMFGQHRSVDRTMQHTWRTIYKKIRARKLVDASS